MTRLIVDMPDELLYQLEEVARRRGLTRDQALYRSFALLLKADEERTKGNSIIIARDLPGNRMRPLYQLTGIFNG
ncbi:hypothetical protein E4L96_02990 [Massilia arenosa]|uniref:Ribbon-helix-helix protein, CopG family n=1 Tax=Zemynaea arenosa TaxID=2561931 RepID=A0A4Y9SN11_9BURK|nr:hypothetical protein [Massilia arenosa]TFW28040.1 hypothetical protein E4L96_02990 [Massilia arenosa]